MVTRDELIEFIYSTIGEELVAKALAKDELANGVQIAGQEEVNKVVLGVTLTEDFLNEASAAKAEPDSAKAQFCIFHHGLDVRAYRSRYPKFTQKRLRLIFENKLTIMAFHYALDCHPTIGNNSVIIKKLGATIRESLFEEWGYTATFASPQDVKALSQKCSKLFEHDVFAVFAGPQKITKIGVVSGAARPAADHLAEMEAKGVQLFITGEPSERYPHIMKELGINYFAGGHYATEVFGVQELGKVIKDHFRDKVEVGFVDIPNPI